MPLIDHYIARRNTPMYDQKILYNDRLEPRLIITCDDPNYAELRIKNIESQFIRDMISMEYHDAMKTVRFKIYHKSNVQTVQCSQYYNESFIEYLALKNIQPNRIVCETIMI